MKIFWKAFPWAAVIVLSQVPLMAAGQQTNQDRVTVQDSLTGEGQFDFWIGEWNLSWGDTAKGYNRVEKILGGKVVQENFSGLDSAPLRGTSVSVYDKHADIWRQTWVDNQGGYLDFSGRYKNGKMVLSREAHRDGQRFLQRMVWYNIKHKTFDWNWERSDDNGKTWKVMWQIHYVRITK